MTVDTSSGKQFFQAGATLPLDFGYNKGGLAVNDQFGRAIDLTNQDTTAATHYEAIASVTNGGAYLTLGGTNATATTMETSGGTAISGIRVYNNQPVTLTAVAAGTATVKYEIYSVNAAGTVGTDTVGKTVQYTVVNDSDITSYALDTVPNAIKTVTLSGTDETLADYSADPTIWGKTSGGVEVRLNPAKIMSVSLDSSDFS